MTDTAETILVGGRIWQGLAEGFAEALAISGGKVLATGTRAEIEALAGPETKVLDLKGRLAMPGINDAHMHLHMYGLAMKEIDFRPSAISSIPEALAAIAERVKTTAPGEWITGRGFDDGKVPEGRMPTIEELDSVCPENPMLLTRTDGHVTVANSKAMELAGVTADTPSPVGGLIEVKDGKLTGLLAETGRDPVYAVMPKATREDLIEAIERGGQDLLTYGITSVMEAAIGIRDGWTEMEAYLEAHEAGRLPIRVYGTIMGDKSQSIVDQAAERGLVTGAGDEMFRIGGVKLFTDGSMSGRTAAVSKPYEGSTDNYGLMLLSDEECAALVLKAHKLGYQMAIHAIGDVAIEQVIKAYEAALASDPAEDRRHRIEHCGWLTDEQIARMSAIHALPAGQPSFIYYFGDLYLKYLGDRSQHCYPMRKWIDAGLQPSASTDCPVTRINPFPTMYAMIARKSDTGSVLGAAEALSVAEALHAYTYASAYAAKEEGIKGRLVPGQLADVAVLTRDIFEVDEAEIPSLTCDITILGGEVVYEREKELETA
ncbi:amidohydrolase [Paroceanicella profunda]|uniref:Amidohydrolase n=1 Tax=Paroceanicella profunda TaxID=2579971 RepID=A0A5B8FH85_9RHOB|nr:amidohydrolase [Paroceanicella profunda]QDL91718.1 amidohydrolase [Paroceanicella profunda]